MEYIKKHGVYISLTSSPIRLKKSVIALSLVIKNPYIKYVYVTLPKLYRNKKPYLDSHINFVKNLSPKIKILRPSKDIGPITKILPTLQHIKDPLSIVISMDDDIAYPSRLINELIYHSIKYPNIIWTGSGFVWEEFAGTKSFNRKKVWPLKRRPTWPTVDIIEGWGLVSYKKKMVNIPLLRKLASLNLYCKLSDDVTLSYFFALKNIKMRNISTKYYENDKYLYPFKYGLDADALHKGSGLNQGEIDNANIIKYLKCLDTIYKNKSLVMRKSRGRRGRRQCTKEHCKQGKVVNPKTGRCVKRDGRIGKNLCKSLDCKRGKIVNPKTGRCVKRDGRIGKNLCKSLDCKRGKIVNPKTGRCVKRDGVIGKKVCG